MGIAELSIRKAGWVLVGCLLAVGVVNVAVPQLEEVVADSSLPFIPENAEAVQTFEAMDQAFGNGKTKSILYVVAEREGGLTEVDRQYVKGLVPRLDDDHYVSSIQDVAANQRLFDSLVSKDGEAVYLQVGIMGDTGAPAAIRQIDEVRDLVHDDPPGGLKLAVTGYPTTISDMSHEAETSLAVITVAIVVMITLILTLLYRSVAVTGVVLGFIGLSLAAGRGLAAIAGTLGLDVSTFTASVLTAVVLGASTDYAIFLISRYHEERRNGRDSDTAIGIASSKIGVVIAASALTVILANAAMIVAEVGLFRTTGPAIALGIAGTLALSMTMLPAAITVMGRRGMLDPRPVNDRGGWKRISTMVVTRPGRVLLAGLLPLIVLAAFYPALTRSFDERSVQPDDTESNQGFEMIADHYPRQRGPGRLRPHHGGPRHAQRQGPRRARAVRRIGGPDQGCGVRAIHHASERQAHHRGVHRASDGRDRRPSWGTRSRTSSRVRMKPEQLVEGAERSERRRRTGRLRGRPGGQRDREAARRHT